MEIESLRFFNEQEDNGAWSINAQLISGRSAPFINSPGH